MRAGMMREMGWQVDEINRDQSASPVLTGEAEEMNGSWFQRRGDERSVIFQAGYGWRARKSDNRWGAGTARRLKRDKDAKIARLNGCKNIVREKSLYSMRSLNFSAMRHSFEEGIWTYSPQISKVEIKPPNAHHGRNVRFQMDTKSSAVVEMPRDAPGRWKLAKSLKVIWNYTVLYGVCVIHCNYVYLLPSLNHWT